MKAKDVTATLDPALFAAGLDKITARRTSRRISRNGWIAKRWSMSAAPLSPADPGKIEHWRQTLKNRILLEHYYLPGDL
jgi:putative transposase